MGQYPIGGVLTDASADAYGEAVISPEDAKCPKQIMSTGEDTSPWQALPDNLPNPVKLYKRESQEKFFRCGRIFSYFPACVNEQGWFWPSAHRCGHS
jgi:hypothetical protein